MSEGCDWHLLRASACIVKLHQSMPHRSSSSMHLGCASLSVPLVMYSYSAVGLQGSACAGL